MNIESFIMRWHHLIYLRYCVLQIPHFFLYLKCLNSRSDTVEQKNITQVHPFEKHRYIYFLVNFQSSTFMFFEDMTDMVTKSGDNFFILPSSQNTGDTHREEQEKGMKGSCFHSFLFLSSNHPDHI